MKKLTVFAFISIFTLSCQASDNSLESLIESSEQLLQSEDSKTIHTMSMNFEEYFQQFKQAVNSENTELFIELTDLDTQSAVDIEELTSNLDMYMHSELISDLTSMRAGDLQDTTLLNGEPVKVYNFYEETIIDGHTMESSTLLYFQNTENGWKLIRVMIAG